MLALIVASCKREPVEHRAEAAPAGPATPVAIGVTFAGPASPEIEAAILAPIETALRALPGVRSTRSVARTGRGVVIAELASAARLPDVQRLAAQLPAQLPTLTGAPTVVRGDPEAMPALWLDLQGQAPAPALSRTLSGPVADQLGRVPGVLDLDLRNLVTRAVIVRLDPARLDALGVSLAQLEHAIAAASVADIAALAQRSVARPGGPVIQLREVATVEDGALPQPPPPSRPRLGVRLQPGVDAVQVVTAIRTAVRGLARTLPAGWTLLEVPGPPATRHHTITIAVRGPRWARVVELAEHLAQIMRAHPELATEVASSYVAAAAVQDHRVDAGAAARLGLAPAQLAAIRSVFDEVGRLADGTPVVLRVGRHDRIEPDDLAVLRLDTGQGARVPLSAVTQLSLRAEPTIARRDADDVIDVFAEPAAGKMPGAAAAALIQLAGAPPAGYRIEAVPSSQ